MYKVNHYCPLHLLGFSKIKNINLFTIVIDWYQIHWTVSAEENSDSKSFWARVKLVWCQVFGLSSIWSVQYLICPVFSLSSIRLVVFGLSIIQSVQYSVCPVFCLSSIQSVQYRPVIFCLSSIQSVHYLVCPGTAQCCLFFCLGPLSIIYSEAIFNCQLVQCQFTPFFPPRQLHCPQARPL